MEDTNLFSFSCALLWVVMVIWVLVKGWLFERGVYKFKFDEEVRELKFVPEEYYEQVNYKVKEPVVLSVPQVQKKVLHLQRCQSHKLKSHLQLIQNTKG